jgi:nicotinamidase-related amidase
LIVGNPVLLVIDIQRGWAMSPQQTGIALTDNVAQVIANAEILVASARACSVPVVYFKESHRRSGIDFGRELDGEEGVHCVEGDLGTELWPSLVPLDDEHLIVKRRYSAFFGTELEILLKGLGASTLLLIGGLTDVCVHYTFADAHQHDYHARVVEDCVVGSSDQRHEAAVDAMQYLQHAARCTTREVVTALEVYAAQRTDTLVDASSG